MKNKDSRKRSKGDKLFFSQIKSKKHLLLKETSKTDQMNRGIYKF